MIELFILASRLFVRWSFGFVYIIYGIEYLLILCSCGPGLWVKISFAEELVETIFSVLYGIFPEF